MVVVLALGAATAQAAIIVSYHDGTTSLDPITQAAGITGSSISYKDNDKFRTSF